MAVTTSATEGSKPHGGWSSTAAGRRLRTALTYERLRSSAKGGRPHQLLTKKEGKPLLVDSRGRSTTGLNIVQLVAAELNPVGLHASSYLEGGWAVRPLLRRIVSIAWLATNRNGMAWATISKVLKGPCRKVPSCTIRCKDSG